MTPLERECINMPNSSVRRVVATRDNACGRAEHAQYDTASAQLATLRRLGLG